MHQILVRAPDSINGGGYTAAGGAASSFDEHASTGKATRVFYSLKFRK